MIGTATEKFQPLSVLKYVMGLKFFCNGTLALKIDAVLSIFRRR